MEVIVFEDPRKFPVGVRATHLSHVANIALESNEMITFTSAEGREYDVTAKDWGYYATPSLGQRLKRFGIRAALIRNIDTRNKYVVLVFDDQIAAWNRYMRSEHLELVAWLDDIAST